MPKRTWIYAILLIAADAVPAAAQCTSFSCVQYQIEQQRLQIQHQYELQQQQAAQQQWQTEQRQEWQRQQQEWQRR